MTIYRDDLERVYALIEKPEAWTTSVNARDAAGKMVDALSKDAICWCAIGAFQKLGLADTWGARTGKDANVGGGRRGVS